MFKWLRIVWGTMEPTRAQGGPEERCSLNVAGAFYTCGNCLACGLPEEKAPDLLAPLTDGNCITYFKRQPRSADEVERACQAIATCCLSDLRYGGTDPAIIRRLHELGAADSCDHPLR